MGARVRDTELCFDVDGMGLVPDGARAKFSLPGQGPLEVSHQFEFGASVGFAVPTKLWILENPRIGVSYRFGDGLTGVRLNFGFPF